MAWLSCVSALFRHITCGVEDDVDNLRRCGDRRRVVDRACAHVGTHPLGCEELGFRVDHAVLVGDQDPARSVFPPGRPTGTPMEAMAIGRCTAARIACSPGDAFCAKASAKAASGSHTWPCESGSSSGAFGCGSPR